MTAAELHRRAVELGLRLEARGDKLVVSPSDRCPAEFAAVLRAHKPALLAWLTAPRVPGWGKLPPSNLPLDPRPPRPAPADRERLLAYLLRQTGARPGPLAAWLVRRESAYFDGPGNAWDCALLAYAAARDAACWQLAPRSEAEVLDLLRGCQEVKR
jgi:hypothetical protein